jgi:pimeloyl-ACP methyl ester carboxylesterase
MAYQEQHLEINGIDTAVFSAGQGDTVVFLHGAGTLTGFDSLLPIAESCRLVVAHHPGFGSSADDTTVDSIHDYVLHYLDLFDALELGEVSLVGHSMGGHLAAMLAATQGARIRRLVLAAPAGLRVREHPTADIFAIPDEELPAHLAEDMSVFAGHVPMPPTPEFLAERYRETTSAARLLWARSYDVKLPKWLHRVTQPTLLLWGEADRIVPVQQAAVWADHLPNAEVRTLPGIGHLLFDESRDAVDAVAGFVGAGAAVLAKEA